jgi:replicative DNA helicase Mcm
VWKKENISDVKVQSMNGDLKIKSLKPATIWKLKAPETMVELELASGKKIELTANTKVFSIEKGKTCWKKSKYIKKGTHIATPRRLIGGKTKKEYAVDSVKSNPVIHNVKPFVKKIVDKISLKYKSTRNAAKKIGINENKLYHNWVNEKARGNIKLKDLIKLCFEAGADYKHVVKVVSLYNGKKHNIPSVLTKEFLYAAGLVAGDGDISKTKNTYSVRVSNSENKIHQIFEKTIKKEFGLKSNFTAATEKRPGATRFQSKILAEILFSLGLCQSPKSNKLFFSEKLLHLTNDLLSAYIAGLYDTDGSVCKRKTGSDCIDFTSCSEQLARQLQLVLLRYEIHSRLRKRPPTNSKIKGKYDRWVLEIRGIDEITKFYKNFQLKHPEKIKKLKKIVSKKIKSNTNIDVIPDIKDLLIPLLTEHKIAKRKIGNISNISRGRFQKLVSETPLKTNEYIKNLAFSDIFWDVVKCVRQKKTGYEYVYDLTVQNAHNFVVDGVFVHNTAAVVKDDFLRGWALEAGALVLANKGFVMIDELDKMSKEDTSAMHEALEQQSYHPNTEILFSDGSVETIGTFVDLCINNNRKRVINGKDCEILPIDEAEILTTDFQNIFPAKIDAVSRHLAPKEFLKIKYSNGRSIMVTPDHPIFVFKDGEIKTIKANKLKTGMLAPCPVKLPTKHKKMKLIPRIIQHYNNKQIQFPAFVDDSFSRLLGYITTEGHSYYNPNTRYAEIGISNTDKKITEECKNLFENIFQTTVNINSRLAKFSKKATKDMDTVRCSSIPFYSFLKENFDEITEKTPKKRTGNLIRRLEKHNIKHFLRTAFKGDGFVDSERFGFSTASYGLAKDYQDLLLQNNIWSYIATENRMGTTYHKVVVSGLKNMTCFLKNIVEKNDHRFDKLKKFCQRAEHRLNNRNPVPLELVERVDTLLKSFGLSNGYFHKIIKKGHNSNKAVVEKYLKLVELRINNCKEIINSSNVKLIRKTLKIPVQKIAKILKTSCSNVYYLEKKNNRRVLFVLVKKIANKKIEEKTKELNQLKKFILSDLQLITVKNVEIIKNKDIKWVYDITVDPTKTFISEGLVLHNSVSISKANIQATLRCETTVLAAANPKWGRFDPYEILGKQINLPSPLISRFDLIFPIRDLPNKEQDERLATFLLNLHQTSHAGACEIETDMLKKFIAYARKTCVPKLTDEALEELKNYYVRMRNAGGDEGAVKAIPITARQLEALVRLAEASAKTRLSDRVLKKDALKAIELLHFCMSQVGIDPDTGKIDIDVLTTGVSSSARSNIIIIKEIINELENKIGKTIPVEDIIKEAQEKGVSADKAEEVLEKLKRAGDIFEPKRMFVQKI